MERTEDYRSLSCETIKYGFGGSCPTLRRVIEMEMPTVGMLANRDPELMSELRRTFRGMGIVTQDIDPDTYPETDNLVSGRMGVVLPKLLTRVSNTVLFASLRDDGLRFLNSLDSVDICQSRRKMFGLMAQKLSRISTPAMFEGVGSAERAIQAGRKVWVRRDEHNIQKGKRVLGKASTVDELDAIVEGWDPDVLFFQEYLGESEEVFKAYVIGEKIYCLKKTGTQDGFREDRALPAVPVDVDETGRKVIMAIGRAFDMTVYGVDYLMQDGHPMVLDVNDFPSFRGIPGAAREICHHVYREFLNGE